MLREEASSTSDTGRHLGVTKGLLSFNAVGVDAPVLSRQQLSQSFHDEIGVSLPPLLAGLIFPTLRQPEHLAYHHLKMRAAGSRIAWLVACGLH